MKLKLDLHPIYGNSQKIEAALNSIIDEACDIRAAEIEIIPGKGSGALKKCVMRFLERPEVKSRYHRIEKDSDNWGRLFVHFRWNVEAKEKPSSSENSARADVPSVQCFCCGSPVSLRVTTGELSQDAESYDAVCHSCGSPNRITVWLDRMERIHSRVDPSY